MKDLFKQKKFRVALGGAVSVLLAALGLPVGIAEPVAQLLTLVTASYVVGQGLADLGKEAAKETNRLLEEALPDIDKDD